ncbi:Cof-like hydrolase [Rippkaea orientalis PCC 8801]|uniref:Cof-like hydrolase n=1 Tax=Rippkaea orientalis (strain PCC 8801 / RF-1) TaxID=41431 RepID=B7K5B3_RIPO1|nr:Cof-type HAD-IIB family hydrolase [Rippkaea orientalis]ACK67939.1 Cof-like hydrolase [Rippkaea orientalis PCC 8801]
MNIRLLVLDIDGTIAGESNSVSEPVKQAIAQVQANGIQVALATGRMYYSALRFHQAIDSQLPIIAYNGAWIQCPLTGVRHQHFPVPSAIALELLDYFEQPQWNQDIEVHCYIDDRLYVREVTPRTQVYQQRSGIEPVVVGDLRNILALKTTKVLAIGKPNLMNQLLSELQQQYRRDQLHLTQSTPSYFEVTHPQASKGYATRFLAEELLGFEASQVMAIGDNFNDAEMLEYVGLGVAMGNAPEPIQQMAQWIAPSVEEDGVATAIKKFLLN